MKTRIAGVFSKKSLLIAAFARAAIGSAASASVVEVEYTMPGGRGERESRDMPEAGGVCVQLDGAPLAFDRTVKSSCLAGKRELLDESGLSKL